MSFQNPSLAPTGTVSSDCLTITVLGYQVRISYFVSPSGCLSWNIAPIDESNAPPEQVEMFYLLNTVLKHNYCEIVERKLRNILLERQYQATIANSSEDIPF